MPAVNIVSHLHGHHVTEFWFFFFPFHSSYLKRARCQSRGITASVATTVTRFDVCGEITKRERSRRLLILQFFQRKNDIPKTTRYSDNRVKLSIMLLSLEGGRNRRFFVIQSFWCKKRYFKTIPYSDNRVKLWLKNYSVSSVVERPSEWT